ncbi:hypothetical protein LINPERPRIM_LOCUS31831 [Linum perenne]
MILDKKFAGTMIRRLMPYIRIR